MDFQSFSHGQMHSKIWLSEMLETYLQPESNILVLGCWHNIMGMILMIRNPHMGLKIMGIDIDSEAIDIADKLTEAWRFEEFNPFKNQLADANTYNYDQYDVFINCSVEHMESDKWFQNITSGTLVCIQSSNVLESNSSFDIKSPNQNIDSITTKFPCRKFYHKKTKHFQYNEWGYDRLMTIGIK